MALILQQLGRYNVVVWALWYIMIANKWENIETETILYDQAEK